MEKKIEIHDENGFVELQTIVIEEIPQIQSTEDMISQKEQQLLQIYNELQALKNNK